MDRDERLIELLERQVALLEVIAARVGARPVRKPLRTDDREALALALPAIHGAIGAAVFTVRDLQAHAERYADLGLTLERALSGSLPNRAKAMGKLLLRGSQSGGVDGFRVTRELDMRDGAGWAVRQSAT